MRRQQLLCGVFIALVACGHQDTPTGPSPGPPSTGGGTTPPDTGPDIEAVLVGAGDIGWCGVEGRSDQTAALLDAIPGAVFTVGDNAYMSGSAENFRRCYEPTWGRHKTRTRPTPGNHDYETPGAADYFAYFGVNAGPPGAGYYTYQLGAWQIFALNSEVPVSAGSAQLAWLRAELGARPTRCALAYFHEPLFGSGTNGGDAKMREAWRVMYELGVDVVLSGHNHSYERFAPQDPDGRFDPERGIRQFVAGTGGAPVTGFPRIESNSEMRSSTWGVLKLTLRRSQYAWEFVPVPGQPLPDSGSGSCH